jgi:hypothetical protein
MVKRRTYKHSRAAMLKTLILAAAAFLFFASCTTIEGAYPDGSKLAKSDSHPFGNKSEARTAAAYADGKEAEGEIIRRGDRELLVSDGYIVPHANTGNDRQLGHPAHRNRQPGGKRPGIPCRLYRHGIGSILGRRVESGEILPSLFGERSTAAERHGRRLRSELYGCPAQPGRRDNLGQHL